MRVLGNILRTLWTMLSNIVYAISTAFSHLSQRGQRIVLIIVALFALGFAVTTVTGTNVLLTHTGTTSSTEISETVDEDTLENIEPPEVTYSAVATDLQDIDYVDGTITPFSLVEDGIQMFPTLSASDNEDITEIVTRIQDKGDNVGFLIASLDSGSGFCYNLDTPIYGASTYKAPMSAFICEQLIETGDLKKSSVSDYIENAILWSDNASYRTLKHNYEGTEHNAWLTSLGVDPDDFQETFPTYSVRESAALWVNIWNYVKTGTDTATWFGNLLTQTETSFLRDAVTNSNITSATVYNKAGWCVSNSGVEDAVNDAGIVKEGDYTYLVIAFSSSADCDSAEADLTDLLEALLNVRHELDPAQATWDNVKITAEAAAATYEASQNTATSAA